MKTNMNKGKFCTFLAFTLPVLYWGYLSLTSHMIIAYDSIDYEHLGQILSYNKWAEYFSTGPNREPAYPLLIAMAMKISYFFGIGYQKILTLFQIGILGLTQILTLKILNQIQTKTSLKAIILLYLGFSPAIVNSGLSLYSEIMTYPFILSLVILAATTWYHLLDEEIHSRIWIRAMLFSFIFVLITLTKNVFEIIFPVFLLPFAMLILKSHKTKPKVFQKGMIFIIVSVLTFYIPINIYKSLNKSYNGQFVVTNRGAWALYGNTSRRMAPLNQKRFWSALAYAPGKGVCQKIFSQEECDFWSYKESDTRGMQKSQELLAQGVPQDQLNQRLIQEAIGEVFKNPLQYGLFMGIEGLKMMFWESTQIGWVVYPKWLDHLFRFTPFKNGLRLGIFLFTIFALIVTIVQFLKKSRSLANASNDKTNFYIFFILLLIATYIGTHSFFFTLTRYSLPIAPLFLILIGYSIQSLEFQHQENKDG